MCSNVHNTSEKAANITKPLNMMSFIAEKAIRKSAPLGAFLSAFKSSQAEQMCFSAIAEMVFILYTHRGGDNGVRDLEWRNDSA